MTEIQTENKPPLTPADRLKNGGADILIGALAAQMALGLNSHALKVLNESSRLISRMDPNGSAAQFHVLERQAHILLNQAETLNATCEVVLAVSVIASIMVLYNSGMFVRDLFKNTEM